MSPPQKEMQLADSREQKHHRFSLCRPVITVREHLLSLRVFGWEIISGKIKLCSVHAPLMENELIIDCAL